MAEKSGGRTMNAREAIRFAASWMQAEGQLLEALRRELGLLGKGIRTFGAPMGAEELDPPLVPYFEVLERCGAELAFTAVGMRVPWGVIGGIGDSAGRASQDAEKSAFAAGVAAGMASLREHYPEVVPAVHPGDFEPVPGPAEPRCPTCDRAIQPRGGPICPDQWHEEIEA